VLLATDSSFATLPQLAIAIGNLEIIRLWQHYNLDSSTTTHPENNRFDLSERSIVGRV
jgi:hypothetical protein